MNKRIPLLSKFVLLYLLFAFFISVFSYFVYTSQTKGIIFTTLSSADAAPFTLFLKQVLLIGMLAGLFCFSLLYLREKIIVKKLNFVLRDGLKERKLEQIMDQYIDNNNFLNVTDSVSDMLILLRSMDQLKSSKIAMDNHTLKLLLTNIEEGILIISPDRIVTHVNRKGEDLLKLIPGEIVGQSVSRKVSHGDFLDQLDRAIDQNQKIADLEITIQDSQPLVINIFPVKNKFGEVVRALVIIEKSA